MPSMSVRRQPVVVFSRLGRMLRMSRLDVCEGNGEKIAVSNQFGVPLVGWMDGIQTIQTLKFAAGKDAWTTPRDMDPFAAHCRKRK